MTIDHTASSFSEPQKLAKTPVALTVDPTSRASSQELARSAWVVPILLVVLSLVPSIAGSVRLSELAGGAAVTDANARFFANPLPVVVHIVSASLFCVVGAFQFSKGLRRRYRGWHRTAGRALVPLGLAAGGSGLWLTLAYPFVEPDGWTLYGMRLVLGSAMMASIGLAVRALVRRDYASHGAWMMRGYAIGLGAGTQVLTYLAWFLIGGPDTEFGRVVVMGSGWAINMVVAEWVIRRRHRVQRVAGRGVAEAAG